MKRGRPTKQIEIDRLQAKIAELEREQKRKADEAKKRYDAIVYCANCLQVTSVSIPPGVTIEAADCVTCRVRGQLKQVVGIARNLKTSLF